MSEKKIADIVYLLNIDCIVGRRDIGPYDDNSFKSFSSLSIGSISNIFILSGNFLV